ncbi:unnamed protein product [Dibothriocephalus latus]|uniref:Reverse transcriptase domain-containing protein n=1 Tax=Dibothriocephalus latus TaxID=60516 RepID=A0A3P7M9J0_DIBLA|nr:unnamed protein product [Dibothriocephalus latus]
MLETANCLCDIIQFTNFQIAILRELRTRCTQNVLFLCNCRCYRLIGGVAMGSPHGPFLSNVFMGKIEETRHRETTNDLAFYGRYVDYTFCPTDYNINTIALVQ